MIKVESRGFPNLEQQLSERAAKLAETAAKNRMRTRSRDPQRWRRAELLWPLFWEGR